MLVGGFVVASAEGRRGSGGVGDLGAETHSARAGPGIDDGLRLPRAVHLADIAYATSGRVISGDRRCNARLGPVRGTVLHVATAVPVSASTISRTRCGVVMT